MAKKIKVHGEVNIHVEAKQNFYVRVSQPTHKKLNYMKIDLDAPSINDVIDYLINNYKKEYDKLI